MKQGCQLTLPSASGAREGGREGGGHVMHVDFGLYIEAISRINHFVFFFCFYSLFVPYTLVVFLEKP